MAHVSGRPLAEWQAPGADTAPFRAAGRALAALHDCPVDPGRTWSAQAEIDVALRALDAATALHPCMSDHIAPLRARAAGLAGACPPPRVVLLHRDFYPDQALVEADRLWLVDLDLAARGDAHVDLGNMLAHLTEYAIRQFGDADALSLQAAAFLDGYVGGGGCWSKAGLDEMHAISLMRHLDICTRLPGRMHAFNPLLAHLVHLPPPAASTLSC
jgi:aminoglycoside phosphotransferase (APT) family kinase protein